MNVLLSYYILCISFVYADDITAHPNWRLLDDEECGVGNEDRIMGGKRASLGQFPWLAQLSYAKLGNRYSDYLRFKCGGALINPNYVLTAAHCVTNLPPGQYVNIVRLGEFNTETETDCVGNVCADPVQDIKPHKIIYPDDLFDTELLQHDIALIHLSSPANYTEWVSPICLPHGSMLSKDYVGQLATVAGWGVYDNYLLKSSTILKFVKLPVKPNEKCVKDFQQKISLISNQLCVGGIVGEDTCSGDSGGPLSVVEAIDGPPRTYVLGIVSYGAKLCGKNTSAVYTKVSSYMEWILDQLEK